MDPGRAATDGRLKQRVLIVDDNAQVRRELGTLLRLTGELEIVGEAEDGLEAVRLVGALSPDVVLIDLAMPGLDGYEATRRIRAAAPCRIVVLTVHGTEEAREKARRCGADAFLVKGVSLKGLLEAILGGDAAARA